MSQNEHKKETIEDGQRSGWVGRAPTWLQPFLLLSRLDRPIGFWLLAIPCWAGLLFGQLATGTSSSLNSLALDASLFVVFTIGAIAMRGAGCTLNDIFDRKLDAQVKRTRARPLASGTVSVRAAILWIFAQCLVGVAVLIALPPIARWVALVSVPLVIIYPFLKRFTHWPQAWLGLTFNWGFLVAYAAETGALNGNAVLFYCGLAVWTLFYDTIYACQDKEDDALIDRTPGPECSSSINPVGLGNRYYDGSRRI